MLSCPLTTVVRAVHHHPPIRASIVVNSKHTIRLLAGSGPDSFSQYAASANAVQPAPSAARFRRAGRKKLQTFRTCVNATNSTDDSTIAPARALKNRYCTNVSMLARIAKLPNLEPSVETSSAVDDRSSSRAVVGLAVTSTGKCAPVLSLGDRPNSCPLWLGNVPDRPSTIQNPGRSSVQSTLVDVRRDTVFPPPKVEPQTQNSRAAAQLLRKFPRKTDRPGRTTRRVLNEKMQIASSGQKPIAVRRSTHTRKVKTRPDPVRQSMKTPRNSHILSPTAPDF